MPALSSIEARLRDTGLRRTPVRLAVLKLLDAAHAPMDATTIVGKIGQPIDTVTVYRTLNTFTRKKLVHRVSSESGWRYAIGRPDAKPAHQHPHFVCDECGLVECMTDSAIPSRLLPSLKLDPRYTVSYAEVVLHGRCKKCG